MPDTDAIQEDVFEGNDGSDEAAVAELLEAWDVPNDEEPSDESEEQEDTSNEEDDVDDDADEETETEGDDEATDEDSEEEAEEGDDESDEEGDEVQTVEIKVGDEVHQVPITELTPLWGRNKALTQKEEQVAELRREWEGNLEKQHTSLNLAAAKAAERWKPYAEMDFMILSKELDSEDFAQLRKDALSAYNEYQFFNQELDNFVGELQKSRAAEASKLGDSEEVKKVIPEWNADVYKEVREYAKSAGLDDSALDRISNPAALAFMYKAMKFDNQKTVATKKKAKGPRKLVKKTAATRSNDNSDKYSAAMQRLSQSGDEDDAVQAFMAMWEE